MGWREDWSGTTFMLVFAVIAFSFGDLLFGIDTGAFGALQVLPSWRRDFAPWNEAQQDWLMPTWTTSLMNSIVFLGSFVGCASFEPICERFGYKITIYLAGIIQIIAVIVELTSKHWGQFTAGRVLAYVSVGLVENASPGYCSEISPAAIRGFMSGSMTVIVTVGNTIGAGVNLPFANEERSLGWIIPTSIQFVPALGILLMVPFCPESPRWLVSKGKMEQALKAIEKIRPRRDKESGATVLEIEAIRDEVEYSRTQEQGRWMDLFSRKYIKRTFIVLGMFLFYQTTGGQFVNVYGPTFYRQLGLGDMVFVYATIGQGVGIAATIIGILMLDKLGRRPPVITGATILVVCNILIGSLGPQDPETISTVDQNVVITSIMLLLSAVKISFQCCSFLLASEVGGNRMRKKFMGFGTSVDVLFRFLFIFIIPYLINDPLYMGARFGFVMAFFSLCSLIFAIFCVPETRGRALEEMDELFGMKLWPWQWSKAKTTGIGAEIARLEAHGEAEKARELKKEAAETEHVDAHRRSSDGATATIEDTPGHNDQPQSRV